MRSWSDLSQCFFDYRASGTPEKWLKRCSVVRNHTFTTFASKLLGKRLGIDFGLHFGVILVLFSSPREVRKTTKKLTIFRSIFFEILAPTWPPRCDQIGPIWGLLVCIFALLRPSLLDTAPGRPPDLPKHPSRPWFSQFFNHFRHDFLTHFWTRCLQNVLDHFSGKSAMQPVSEKSPPRFFPACVQELSHNTSKIRWSWQFFYNRQNSGGRRWLAKRLQ